VCASLGYTCLRLTLQTPDLGLGIRRLPPAAL